MSRRKKPTDSIDDFFANDQQTNVASMTECTGLTQIPPFDQEEVDSLTDIYAVPLTTNKVGKSNKK